MNLALAHCWKEWRTQRSVLLAYAGLVFASLCLGFTLVPEHWWLEDGRRALSLSWFVAAGVIGVVGFAAPALVRGEFGAKDDQFVRRLPGALGPSFHGKLVFLVLATLAFPLVGLLWGEVFLQAIGQSWHDLFTWRHDGTVVFEWPGPALSGGCALLFTSWVWAIGTWLPGGRMAVGGTLLFGLVLGLGVTAVLRQCPNLEQGIAWQGWLWAVVPLGLAVAAWSWTKGRRGGGALRSARFGLAATSVALAPPAAWLGHEAWCYHHPDLQHLAALDVQGLSPDGRFVLAHGAAQAKWYPVTLRIDLATGAAQQVAGMDRAFTPELMRVNCLALHGTLRHWFGYGEGLAAPDVFDLTTGERTPIAYDTTKLMPVLPGDLRALVVAQVRASTPLQAPGGQRVWFEDDELCSEQADGTVSRQGFAAERVRSYWPAGHGFRAFGGHGAREERLFDLANRCWVASVRRHEGTWLVRGVLLQRPKGGQWTQQDPGESAKACGQLANCDVLGLFDDDLVLCAQTATRTRPSRLFLYGPADARVDELAVPDGAPFATVAAEAPIHRCASLLARDPAGRIWLRCGRDTIVLLDGATRATTQLLPEVSWGRYQLLGWPDAHSVLVNEVLANEGARVLRIDIATGARTVLFPVRT